MNIGERIKVIRKQKNMTQETLANTLGVQRSAISKYEKGIVSPSWETIEKIAASFEMSIDQLLSDVDMLSYDKEAREKFERVQNLMIEQIPKNKLLSAFDKLNELGQKTAIERVEELSENPKYQKEKK